MPAVQAKAGAAFEDTMLLLEMVREKKQQEMKQIKVKQSSEKLYIFELNYRILISGRKDQTDGFRAKEKEGDGKFFKEQIIKTSWNTTENLI